MKFKGYLWKSRKKDLFRKNIYVRATDQFQVIIKTFKTVISQKCIHQFSRKFVSGYSF